ncbi:MAG: glycogen debranching enzyme, partial [Treponema sp.]|nr:glycogen debranching enzyme [Treponema sp.]
MDFGHYTVESGTALPLGALPTGSGVNFALFSRHATAVTLIVFQTTEPDSPCQEIPLDPRRNKTGDIWHCHIQDLRAGA